MSHRNSTLKLTTAVGIVLCAIALAQEAQKPLSNADIITMVKSKLPESVVVQSIQSTAGKYDTSPTALIALHNAGVTEGEMNAMISASAKGTANAAPVAPTDSNSMLPETDLVQGSTSQRMPMEKTQLAETKTKPTSMTSLAADSAVTQAMQAGVNDAAWQAAVHTNSGVAGAGMEQAGSIVSGIMGHRKPTVTYVWGVPGSTSMNVLQMASPAFSVDFSRTPGIRADDYAPAIVKLTPAQNSCRIVGATEGKEDVRSDASANWQVYSHFLEEPVASQKEKLDTGKFKVAPASPLFPGEYAVVLRPTSKTKAFSGGSVARAEGDGLLFDAVWTFRIADNAK